MPLHSSRLLFLSLDDNAPHLSVPLFFRDFYVGKPGSRHGEEVDVNVIVMQRNLRRWGAPCSRAQATAVTIS